jgi:hypothetical protein
MEKISSIQLSANQANRVIDKYYSIHVDYNCPTEERSFDNPDFVKKEKYVSQRNNLFHMLTSPIGTAFNISTHHGSSFGYIRKVGYTNIETANGKYTICGYRDESCEHIDLLIIFLKAKSFGWFKSKYPVK